MRTGEGAIWMGGCLPCFFAGLTTSWLTDWKADQGFLGGHQLAWTLEHVLGLHNQGCYPLVYRYCWKEGAGVGEFGLVILLFIGTQQRTDASPEVDIECMTMTANGSAISEEDKQIAIETFFLARVDERLNTGGYLLDVDSEA